MTLLTRWNPMREIEDLFENYGRALNKPGRLGMDLLSRGDWVPRVDIAETDTAYVIKMEIPEVDKKNVKVAVDNGVLTIRGERKQEKEEKGRRYHRMERFYGSFERAFALPDNVDEKHLDAAFKDGMLTVTLPKLGEPKHTPIEVQIH